MKKVKKAQRRKIRGASAPLRGAGQAASPKAGSYGPAGGGAAISAGEALEPVMARLTVLHKAAIARRTELETAARGVPQAQPCRFGGKHLLDLDLSSRASYGKPDFVWVYSPCPKCAGEQAKPWWVRSGAPGNLAGATFDNWRPELASDHAALKLCRDYAAAPSGFLLVAGAVGTGKSHLAVAVMRAAGRPARWVTQNTILLALRKTYRDDRAEDIVEACKAVRHLTVDDLGTSTGSRDEFPALYEIIAHRYNEQLSTVFTTNLAPSQFGAVFGDRLEDRLGTATLVELQGESKRK